jgi:hypothetical protein
VKDDLSVADMYDEFAEAYAARVDTNPIMPTTSAQRLYPYCLTSRANGYSTPAVALVSIPAGSSVMALKSWPLM